LNEKSTLAICTVKIEIIAYPRRKIPVSCGWLEGTSDTQAQ